MTPWHFRGTGSSTRRMESLWRPWERIWTVVTHQWPRKQLVLPAVPRNSRKVLLFLRRVCRGSYQVIEDKDYGFEECGQRMDADIEGHIGPGHSKREARRWQDVQDQSAMGRPDTWWQQGGSAQMALVWSTVHVSSIRHAEWETRSSIPPCGFVLAPKDAAKSTRKLRCKLRCWQSPCIAVLPDSKQLAPHGASLGKFLMMHPNDS